MVAEIKPIAELVGAGSEYTKAANYVTSLDLLPLGRVINDAKVSDHHAIIPTRSEHRLDKMGADERRIYDLVARRFLAVVSPRRRARGDAHRDDCLGSCVSHKRKGARRPRLARRLRRAQRGGAPASRPARRRASRVKRRGGRARASGLGTRGAWRATRMTRAGHSSCRESPRASMCKRERSRACARKRSRRGATAMPRCSARWRRRASSWRTRSCARR